MISVEILCCLLVAMAPMACGHETEADTVLEEDLSPVELVQSGVTPGSQDEDLRDSSQPVPTPPGAVPIVDIPPITTTRPSFTDAVITVPQGSLQVETGATYTDNRGGTYSWTLPEPLLRLGVTPNTEVRFSPPTFQYLGNREPGNLINNFGDIAVGMSHHRQAPGKIDLAFIPILNIPTGANKASSNSVDPQLRVVWGKYVTSKWLLSGMLDTRWFTGKDAAAKVVLNPTLINYYNFSDRWIGFLEYGGFVPTTGRTTQFIQYGVLFLPTRRQQFDVRMAVGLNRNSPNLLVGFGYSFRIDGLFGKSREFSSFKKP